VALLEKQLRKADWKLLKLQNQKQNLSETCASQDAYIAQLAREFETLQTSKSQADQELNRCGPSSLRPLVFRMRPVGSIMPGQAGPGSAA